MGLAGKPVALIVTAFLLGGASGAGIYAVLTPPKARTIYVDRPVAVPEPRPFALDSLSRAPADPVINGYYLTTVGQREATLRQLNTVLPASLRSNSF